MPGRQAPEAVRQSQITKAAYHVASRHGLDGLTVRRVAARAHVSTGLVLFHFRTKEQLIIAVLDYLLETTTILHVGDDIATIESPFERLLALLAQEMHRLSSEPSRILLFFDFWARGIRHPAIRAKMQRELTRYRDAFRPMVEEVVRSSPQRFRGVSATSLCAVAVSFIKGCAVQAMIDETFDIDRYLVAAQRMIGNLGEPTPARGLSAARR